MKSYQEEREREKVRECQKALEREKIAKGIMHSKTEELKLRAMQKLQMEEKKLIEVQEKEIDDMWHDVLVTTVKAMEHQDNKEEQRRKQEMLERRALYDEQIASTNRSRSQYIKEERDKENRRLERMKKKMKEDHLQDIKRKKDQQMKNKLNYIEGHEDKIRRLQEEQEKERMMDSNTIRTALNELRCEKEKNCYALQKLRQEERIFREYHDRERKQNERLEREREKLAEELRRKEEEATEQYLRNVADDEKLKRQKTASQYKKHLIEQKQQMDYERLLRNQRMEEVRRTAQQEKEKQLRDAKEEMNKQLEYRRSLRIQIENNGRALENEQECLERKMRPFTKKRESFRDMMEKKIDKSPGRISTNPVHPFRRILNETLPYELPTLPIRIEKMRKY